ncbi:MAG: hypothetical protein CFE45_20410 [Burkholderiales bacterium PBB5]|nr:MAG: hypothetical protein CFE45_20410 [Burkholderiales bacterium PBB5]
MATASWLAPAHAGIAVTSYSMQDGADLHGAYYDNLYNGNRSSGGYLSGGTGDLTDGVLTASVSAGYGAWAPYVLWDGQSPVIVFDLGSEYTLSSVTAYFKYYPQAAVYMPASVDLRYSNDGLNFGSSHLRTLSADERAVPGGDNADGTFELITTPGSGRYVQMTLNNGPENRWIAMSEVVFDGTPGGLSVPEPAGIALVLTALAAMAGARRKTTATT